VTMNAWTSVIDGEDGLAAEDQMPDAGGLEV
jgi:hypothetical protein